MINLTRFWFEFDVASSNVSTYPSHAGMGRGCGVTAYSYDDAIKLLQDLIFRNDPMPPIGKVIENIDVSTLDPNHILPNIGISSYRGIWYPNLCV